MGRFASEEEKASGDVILKDLDINRVLHIGSESRKKFLEQIDKDTKVQFDMYTSIPKLVLLVLGR